VANDLCCKCGNATGVDRKDFCDSVQLIIKDRFDCYETGNSSTALKSSGYCDSKVLKDTSKTPTAEIFKSCYNLIGLDLTD